MNRRTERVASLIRHTIGQLILAKLSDPRIDPARTSVTRVEVPEDLLTARVFISVMGTDAQQRSALRALKHAAGHIQDLMARQITLRNTPMLEFVEDVRFKKSLETYTAIQKAMEETRQKEEARGESAPPQDPQPDEGQASEPTPGQTNATPEEPSKDSE